MEPVIPKESIEEAILALAAKQHGVVSRRQALGLGATDAYLRHQVKKCRYRRVDRGILAIAAVSPSFEQCLLAACLVDEGESVASHRGAATIWSMAGVAPVLEITTTRDRRSRGDLVVYRVRSLPRCDVAVRDAIPLTTPTRTLIDIAAVVDETSLEVALDDALRRGLTSMPRLEWRVSELGGKGRAGTRSLRHVLAQRPRGPAAESPLETRVMRALRGAHLPKPCRQYEVWEGNRLLGRADLAWPERRVILEVDGYRYHSGRREWERDLARRNALEAAGWRVVHVTADQLRARKREFVALMRRLLDGQGAFFGDKGAL